MQAAPSALTDDEIIAKAKAILAKRVRKTPMLTKPADIKAYLSCHFAGHERESFVVLHLDAQHRLIEAETLSLGTLSQCSVYPREVVKGALARNTAAVAFAHNHPSGVAEPSRADEYLTQTLKAALNMVDVRVLDHLVVGADSVVSFAERGLI